MKLFVSLFIMMFISTGFAQVEIKKSNLSTDGGSAAAGSVSVVYSVGEVFVAEQDASSIHLSEGFIGPDILNVNGIENYSGMQQVKVYPNPVQDDLYIDFQRQNKYEIKLYELNGKEILSENLDYTDKTLINMTDLARATYILLIIDRNQKRYQTVKINKR